MSSSNGFWSSKAICSASEFQRTETPALATWTPCSAARFAASNSSEERSPFSHESPPFPSTPSIRFYCRDFLFIGNQKLGEDSRRKHLGASRNEVHQQPGLFEFCSEKRHDLSAFCPSNKRARGLTNDTSPGSCMV